MKTQTIDKRFPLDQPIPADALTPLVGYPKDNRRLVLGLSLRDPHDQLGRHTATNRVRRALRGKANTVIVQHNYGVDGWAEIES